MQLPRSLSIQTPMTDERFVAGETVHFDAALITELWWFWRLWFRILWFARTPEWSSSLEGALGTARQIDAVLHSVGTHTITVRGFGVQASVSVRVLANVGALYVSPPAPGEIARIEREFVIQWDDGASVAEQWATYENDPFDPTSARPSKRAALGKLEALRHQAFSQPYPGVATTLFEHVRAQVHELHFSLGLANQTGGGHIVWLNRHFSEWGNPYWLSLGEALIHETRHNETGDPGHTNCMSWTGTPASGSLDKDLVFQPGSGYSAAATYLMWVARFGTRDDKSAWSSSSLNPESEAVSLLRTRFCSKPTHSDPSVQSILVQLIP